MKFWAILFSVLIMFGGCGSASKKYKAPKKTYIQKGKSIGNRIYYFNQKGVSWVVNNRHKYLSEPYDLKNMLIGADFVKRLAKGYKLNKMTSLSPIDKSFWLYNFGYNKTKNEYLLSGKYIYKDGKYQWPVRFVARYDSKSFELKGIYYCTFGENAKVFVSNSGEYALFTDSTQNTIVNLNTQKSIKFSIPRDMYSFWRKKPIFSKNGKYIAILLEQRGMKNNDKEIIIVETKTGEIKKNFRFYSNTYSETLLYNYTFSDDGKWFFYKGDRKKFTVYDIENAKVVKSFGISHDDAIKWDMSDVSIDKNYFIATYFGEYKDSSKGNKNILYLYDKNSNSVICQIDNEYSFHNFVDEKTNTLHIASSGGNTSIFSIGKDSCKKIGEAYEDKGLSNSYSILSASDGDTRYWFYNGEVKSFTYKKPIFSKEDIEVADTLAKLKRFFEAGFTKKGMKELKNLILHDPYDYFGLQYIKIIKFLTDSQEVYLNVLGYQRYMKRDINIDYYHFHRAIRNYIFIASNRGFKEMIPPMIDVYKKVIGNKPTKKHSDILTVYKANYLLDIGKDDEAYELLFNISPIHKDAKEMISLFSNWNIGLMKNRKKLSVATGIKESELYKTTKSKPLDYFYDLAGNRVKKDISSVKTEKHTPKQNAIKLLD